MAPALLPLAPSPPYPKPPQPPRHHAPAPAPARQLCRCGASRRDFTVHTAVAVASASAAAAMSRPAAAADEAPPSAPPTRPLPKGRATLLGGIANTRSWSQYYGSGFSIRVPPSFDDILEPEDFSAAMTYYGDKAKIRAYAARFASPDRSELVSVVIKPSNQLKITFLEAKDITELGTLKEASKLFVPAFTYQMTHSLTKTYNIRELLNADQAYCGDVTINMMIHGAAKLYSARTIKVKDEEDIRTYYFYEFGFDKQHVALMATVDSGKTYIAAATAPETRWVEDGVKLRSAAVSMSVS